MVHTPLVEAAVLTHALEVITICPHRNCLRIWTNVRYRVLERYVTIQNPNLKVLARVGLDQFVFAPPNIAVFFTAQSLMEGESFREIKAKLDRT
jgi:hypothetical protein